MRPLYTLLAVFIFSPFFVWAQGDNCLSPQVINVCPAVTLVNESTVGLTNDRISWNGYYTLNGKDKVYQINVATGSKYILVSITNSSSSFYVFGTNNICSGNSNFTQYVYANSNYNNIMIPISGTGPYYIWVDSPYLNDFTYTISFGVVETSSTISVPSTKGNWGGSIGAVCSGVSLSKPTSYAEILWNGVHQNVVSYTPLGTPGVVTSRIQLKNTTGVEGVKKIQFTFDAALTNVSPTVTTMPGFYNSGNWISSQAGSVITWTFSDAAGGGWGDFNGISSSCLVYEFSFNMTPTSNSPSQTNVNVLITPDGKGAPSSCTSITGCCATVNNCPIPISGTSCTGGSATGSIGFGFNDPALPVKLVSFDGTFDGQKYSLAWQTASEHNAEKFEVESSENGYNFKTIGSVPCKGESNDPVSYNYVDQEENNYPVYYFRLKQVDNDGNYIYSKVISIVSDQTEIKLFPNPVQGRLNIETTKPVKHGNMYDQMGKIVLKIEEGISGKISYDLSNLNPGIYFLILDMDGKYLTQKIEVE